MIQAVKQINEEAPLGKIDEEREDSFSEQYRSRIISNSC